MTPKKSGKKNQRKKPHLESRCVALSGLLSLRFFRRCQSCQSLESSRFHRMIFPLNTQPFRQASQLFPFLGALPPTPHKGAMPHTRQLKKKR